MAINGVTALVTTAAMLLLALMAGTGAAETTPTQAASTGKEPRKMDDFTVAAYYFPNYHPGDARNRKLKGEGWSEWKLVREARPRFPGHRQPRVPQWGYADESDPQVMARKIDAAADHGVDAFIFDWYYYNDGPFLERALDKGFLGAPNVSRLKFALMWANHDWIDIHPWKRGTPQTLLYPGAVTPQVFDSMTSMVIERYFRHPSYWRIDGKPYFSIYDIAKFIESFGGIAPARKALDHWRVKATQAGLPGLHLNGVVWGQPILPGEKMPSKMEDCVRGLGFDSATSYVWIHHVPLNEQCTDYGKVRDEYFAFWRKAETAYGIPYYPNATIGWDSSPRAYQDDEFGNHGYPFTNTISNNPPAAFREALQAMKARLLETGGPRILNINCWNEWTEGSYLEPDTTHGMGYLEAVRDVFKP